MAFGFALGLQQIYPDFVPILACRKEVVCFLLLKMIKNDGSCMSLEVLRPSAIVNPAHVHILKLVLLRMGFLQDSTQLYFFRSGSEGSGWLGGGNSGVIFLGAGGLNLDKGVANIDGIMFRFDFSFRHLAIFILDARYLIDVLQNQPLFLSRPILQHVPLQPYEAKSQPLSDYLSCWFQKSGSLLEVPLAFLQAEFDICAYSVRAEFLQEFGHGGVIAVVECLGEEDGIGDIPMVVRALLDLSEGPLFLLVVDVPQGLQYLGVGLVVPVIFGIHVHHTAEHGPIGGQTDGGGHQFVPLEHKGAVRGITLREVEPEAHY